jgi:hypothetical protein
MPRGDGTGPPSGSGPGTGRGIGRGVGVVAGWEVTDLELVLAEIVSAPIAEPDYHIR